MPRISNEEVVRHGYAHEVLSSRTLPTITVGAEASTTIDVAIQLKDQEGNPLAEVGAAEVWLSDTAKAAVVATAPSGGWALQASSVLLNAYVANKYGLWLSHTNGIITIRLTEAGALAIFINVRVPGDPRIVSAAVTFAS